MSRWIIDASICGETAVKTALLLSSILGVSVEIKNINSKKSPSGLNGTLLKLIKALKYITTASVEGFYEGSTNVVFEPKTLKSGAYRINLKEDESISELLQVILPISIFVPKRFLIAIKGGTDIEGFPTIDWIENVFLPSLESLFKSISLRVFRRGFAPKGGGVISLQVESFLSNPLYGLEEVKTFLSSRVNFYRTEKGRILKIRGVSVAHKYLQERKVAERQRLGAVEYIKEKWNRKSSINNYYVDADSIGTSITLWLTDEKGNIIGSYAFGKKGKLAEIVGREAAENLVKTWESGATIDQTAAEYLIPLLSLTGGEIKVDFLNNRILKALEVATILTGATFEIDETEKIIKVKN